MPDRVRIWVSSAGALAAATYLMDGDADYLDQVIDSGRVLQELGAPPLPEYSWQKGHSEGVTSVVRLWNEILVWSRVSGAHQRVWHHAASQLRRKSAKMCLGSWLEECGALVGGRGLLGSPSHVASTGDVSIIH